MIWALIVISFIGNVQYVTLVQEFQTQEACQKTLGEIIGRNGPPPPGQLMQCIRTQ